MPLSPHLLTAEDAAKVLGNPALKRTLQRRAAEAFAAGDDNVTRLGDRWCAELIWWRSVAALRPPGRKPKDMIVAGYGAILPAFATVHGTRSAILAACYCVCVGASWLFFRR